MKDDLHNRFNFFLRFQKELHRSDVYVYYKSKMIGCLTFDEEKDKWNYKDFQE